MNKLIVRFILLFKPLFVRMRVDVRQLEVLLSTKLLMDDRRPLTSFGNKPKKESNYSSWINLALLALMGCVLLLFLIVVNKPFLSYTIYFGAFMAMLCLTLIADFSAILLDGRDHFIVLPKPVNDVTFSMARILHIGISVSKQVLGLALPGFVYTVISRGLLGASIFIVQTGIATVLCVLLVNMFYLIAMRFLSVQRFKDIVAYLQILFSVLIFAMYYTMPSLLESAMVQQLDFHTTYWLWFTPGAWIGALQELGVGDFSVLTWSLSILAMITPLLALWLIANRFSKGFNALLAGLDAGDDRKVEKTATHGQASFRDKLAAICTRSPLENAGFKFVWTLTGRIREFKTKVYPSMAYVPVYFFFLFFVRNKNIEGASLSDRWNSVVEQHTYLFIFYFSLLTLLTVFQHITQSEKYKAAWIYFVAPIHQPGQLMSGVLKAAFVKFYMPFMLVFTVLGLAFIGLPIVNDLLLSTVVGGVAAVLICLFTVNGYPFSQPLKKTEGRFIANLLLIGLISTIGFGHYLAVQYEWLIWILVAVFSIVLLILLHYFKKESWEKVEFRD